MEATSDTHQRKEAPEAPPAAGGGAPGREPGRAGAEGARRPAPGGLTEADRDVTVRDFFIFQLKLILDGLKDVVLFHVSIVAIVLDVIAGRGRRPRLFYSVLRSSERFDLWLNLNGAIEKLDESDDGLFGASQAGSDTLLGKLEMAIRGGDEPGGKGWDWTAAWDDLVGGPRPSGLRSSDARPSDRRASGPRSSGSGSPAPRGQGDASPGPDSVGPDRTRDPAGSPAAERGPGA